MWQLAGFAGVLMLIACFVVYFVARSISRPLAEITDRMGELAGGNLAIEVPFLKDAPQMGRLARAPDAFRASISETAPMPPAPQSAPPTTTAAHPATRHRP